MTQTRYDHLLRTVLSALVLEDPMGLSDPAIDLAAEYEAEAREIARRLVHADRTDDQQVVAEIVADVFAAAFDERLTAEGMTRVAARIAAGDTVWSDLSNRLGDAEAVASTRARDGGRLTP